jgi:hypothetical protein
MMSEMRVIRIARRGGIAKRRTILNATAIVALAILLGLFQSVAPAQELHEAHEHMPVGPEKLGKVHFPISCDARAQQEFEQAVAAIHSFWYEEAEKKFTEATGRDPDCSMGYWGIAMSQYYPLWYPPDAEHLKKGWDAVRKAEAIAPKTARERDYIAAIDAFYRDYDKRDYATRAAAYADAMHTVYVRYPQDHEAAAFYALALIATASPTDKTYARQREAGQILERLFAEQPNHPGLAHYIIHAYDNPALASRALPAARLYAKIAPSVPHALHMPSHVFTRLGLWQESIQSNLAAEAAAKDYAVRTHMAGAWAEQLHAMDYLIYAYLQGGQDREAGRIVNELAKIEKSQPQDQKSAYAFAAIPVRYATERGRWFEAASLSPHPQGFPWEQFPECEAIIHFGRALGMAHTGDFTHATQEIDQLRSIRDGLTLAKNNYWAGQVEIMRVEAAGTLAQAQGRIEKSLKLMRDAASLADASEKHPVTPGPIVPARELLAGLLLESNQPKPALTEFERTLTQSPDRLNGLYGAARAAELAGNRKKAENYYGRLSRACSLSDGERPEVKRARAFLASAN